MKTAELAVHEIAVIGGTRALLGAGIGLLAAGHLNDDQRKTAGCILLAIGALSTIPLAISLFRRLR